PGHSAQRNFPLFSKRTSKSETSHSREAVSVPPCRANKKNITHAALKLTNLLIRASEEERRMSMQKDTLL
ncbi:hypothetical protein, partial [Dermatophilus congolensis]|uniref:hypothetical protein n=1 Tax=Dermatophilus congolensis TaxID=1863 RepID=UPI001AAF8628